MSNRTKDWTPNSLEKKCLSHLDSAENWTAILKQEKPPKSQVLDWKPFRKIYVINIVQFIIVLTLVFGSLEFGFGGIAGLREDLPILAAVVATMAILFAAYVTSLYRGSWNRRAGQILHEAQS